MVDIAFAGFLGNQIPEVADFGLADAVNTAKALLQAVRVPRQVVVDHQVGVLQVDTFAGRVGRDQTRTSGSLRNRAWTLRRSSRLTLP